jgi:hypothetical protein
MEARHQESILSVELRSVRVWLDVFAASILPEAPGKSLYLDPKSKGVLVTLSSAANLVDACVHRLFNNFPPPARAMSHVEPLNWELSAVSFGIFISPWGRWASGNDDGRRKEERTAQ